MPQLYPQPVSSTQGVTIRAGAGLFGGGLVALGQSTTLSTENVRQQYTMTPAADGVTGSFTIQGPIPSGYVDVFVGGQLQQPSAYTRAGAQLLFQDPPTSGATMAAVYASPDTRQQYTLSPAANGTNTTFTFPSDLPNAVYVDIYDASGNMLTAGTDYTLNLISGNWTVVFATAPAAAATPIAVFMPTTPDDRNQYALAPEADGATTRFRIIGGAPTGDVDVFAGGLFQVASDAELNMVAGTWVIDFTAAPAPGTTLLVVF
jgi:hypothetical protein